MATNYLVASSQQAGFISPTTGPLTEKQVDQAMHIFIRSITGIDGGLVRPRYQEEPPQQPAFDKDWVAFGINRTDVDMMAYHEQSDTDTTITRDVIDEILLSFYGPNSMELCSRFRDGCEIAQHRGWLRGQGIVLREVMAQVKLPSLMKEKNVKRIDIKILCARRTARVYPIHIIESASVGLDNEQYITPITTPPTT